MSDYRLKILDIYKHDIVDFIKKLNTRTNARIQSNFQIMWKDGYSEGYHVVPIVSFSQHLQKRIIIGTITFYLTDSFQLTTNDYEITFYDDLQEYDPKSSPVKARQPAFDNAVQSLGWLCGEVAKVLDGLDFSSLVVGGDTGGFGAFRNAGLSGLSNLPGDDKRPGARRTDRQSVYTPTRKNISFRTSSGNGTTKVTLAHTAPFRLRKSPTGDEFLDTAPPWYDMLRDVDIKAADAIKKVFRETATHFPTNATYEEVWHAVTEAMYQKGFIAPACAKNRSGYALNEYGECTHLSCPVRQRMGDHDGRCRYQTLDFQNPK